MYGVLCIPWRLASTVNRCCFCLPSSRCDNGLATRIDASDKLVGQHGTKERSLGYADPRTCSMGSERQIYSPRIRAGWKTPYFLALLTGVLLGTSFIPFPPWAI